MVGYLGQLTDKLGGDSIQHSPASAGPNSYVYQTRTGKKKTNKKNPKTVLRAKRIIQTQDCCEQVNSDSIKELVEGNLDGSKEVITHQNIVQDKFRFLLKNSSFQKRFRVVLIKDTSFLMGKLCLLGIEI